MVINGDCLVELKKLPENSVDSVVTDPPYGLTEVIVGQSFGNKLSRGRNKENKEARKGFMGKAWDGSGIEYSVEMWKEVLRVLKPGGYLLSFGGTRTYHRMACAIEDAGFEIRDQIQYLYGSGFPKSLNIAKKLEGVTGKQAKGFNTAGGKENFEKQNKSFRSDYGYVWKPTNENAKQWEGWGTALKPAHEPICMARKPLAEKTVAENVLKYGTGGINIDGSRVEGKLDGDPNRFAKTDGGSFAKFPDHAPVVRGEGRFPANLILDKEAGQMLDRQSGVLHKRGNITKKRFKGGKYNVDFGQGKGYSECGKQYDSGGASRFFYCAKSSRSERNKGLEGFDDNEPAYKSHRANYKTTHGIETPYAGTGRSGKNFQNNHPTVKPISLMRYLVKLVTPPKGTVLDPFAGSFTTGIACKLEGFDFIGIELDKDYCRIGKARIKAWHRQESLFNLV